MKIEYQHKYVSFCIHLHSSCFELVGAFFLRDESLQELVLQKFFVKTILPVFLPSPLDFPDGEYAAMGILQRKKKIMVQGFLVC